MTTVAAQRSLRSHDRLSNIQHQYAAQRGSAETQCGHRYGPDTQRCPWQYASCTVSSDMRFWSATATDVQLAERSTAWQQRPNAHYQSQAAGRRGQTEREASARGGHYQQTQSLQTEGPKKRQQCAARHGPAVRIWTNLTIHWRRKKERKAGK